MSKASTITMGGATTSSQAMIFLVSKDLHFSVDFEFRRAPAGYSEVSSAVTLFDPLPSNILWRKASRNHHCKYCASYFHRFRLVR